MVLSFKWESTKSTLCQLAIALEQESAALHVWSLQARDLLMGSTANVKRYIVIDIGGGTIGVAVHMIDRAS